MRRALLAALSLPLLAALAAPADPPAADWPWWRGPTRDGVAPAGPTPPLSWSETENVLWSAPVPGRGHGSPIVVGDRVFLCTAETDPEVQAVLCFDRATGKPLWRTDTHTGGVVVKGNVKASYASGTPACDGERVFVNFLNAGAVHLTALSLDGKKQWQTKVSDYVLHQGFGSSPTVYKSLVLATADNKGGGVAAGFDRATGNVAWKRERPKQPNYASPIVLNTAGRDQLVLTGCDLVTGLDPLTGSQLWETKGSTTECVTSVVTDGKRVFTSGGYPKNHVSAVAADGTAAVAWENTSRVYVPSMLVKGDHLYAVQDAGVAVCWEAATGKEVWKERLGGTFSASPVLFGDTILAVNEAGQSFAFKASPAGYTAAGQGKLGDEVFASPVVSGGRVYLRVAHTKGGRREVLYCIGKK